MKPYFNWLSEGKYDLAFVEGGTVYRDNDVEAYGDIGTCLQRGCLATPPASETESVVVLDDILSNAEGFAGLAGPGEFLH